MEHSPEYIDQLTELTADPFDPMPLLSFLNERMLGAYDKPVGEGQGHSFADEAGMVIGCYLKYFSKTVLPCGITHPQFRLFLAIQAVSKSIAANQGDHPRQEFQDVSPFDAQYPVEPFIDAGRRTILRSMLAENPIGDFERGHLGEAQVINKLKAIHCDAAGCDLSDLLELFIIDYQCEAGSHALIEPAHGGVDGLFRFSDVQMDFSKDIKGRIQLLRELTRPASRAHDSWSHVYDYVYEKTFGGVFAQFTNAHLDTIRRFLPVGSIIDYGAGTGRLSIPLAQRGYRVIAVEPSTGMATEAERKIRQAGLDIPVRNVSIAGHGQEEPADMALCLFTVMSYITETQEMEASLANIARNLKSGGLLFIDLPGNVFFQRTQVMNVNKPGLKRRPTLTLVEGVIYRYREVAEGVFEDQDFSINDEFDLRKWSWGELVRMLAAAGFEEMEEGFGELGWTGSEYKMFRRKEVPTS